jgi:hypothetical protein
MLTEVYRPVATVHRTDGKDTPLNESVIPAVAVATPPSVAGNVIGVVTNHWRSMEVLSDAIADRLRELGAKEVVRVEIPRGGYAKGALQQASPGLLDEIARKVDGAVVGLGN